MKIGMAFRPPERSTQEPSSINNCCAKECCVETGFKVGFCHTTDRLQKQETKSSKRKSRRSDCAKKRHDSFSVCNCAGSVAGDCAAVCCCPCVIVHLLILALVKLPFAIARKSFVCAKKMAPINKKSDRKKKTDENDDDRSKICRVYSPSWSYRESTEMTEPLEGLPSPKFDSHKLWSELYASGHMGFSGIPCERD